MSTLQTGRIREWDYWRAMALLSVVVIHVTGGLRGVEQPTHMESVYDFIRWLANGLATPLFATISGAVLARNWYESFQIRAFYSKRMTRVVIPYLALSLFLMLPRVISGRMSLVRFAFNILTASASTHLWYIAFIVQIYLLYPFIIRLYREGGRRTRIGMLVLSALLQICASALVAYTRDEVNPISILSVRIQLYQLIRRLFLVRLFNFYLGIIIGSSWASLARRWDIYISGRDWVFISLFLVISSIVLLRLRMNRSYENGTLSDLWAYYFVRHLLRIVQFLPSLVLLHGLASKLIEVSCIGRIGIMLSGLSYGIYLWHIEFLKMSRKALSLVSLGPEHPAFYSVLFVVTLVSTTAVVYLLNLLPYSQILIGSHIEWRSGKG